MSSGSLLPMVCLISSRADFTLKSQCVMSSAPADKIDTQFNALFSTFAILIVFSRDPSSASCVVTATACSRGVVFPKILLGMSCSMVLDSSSLTSRGSLCFSRFFCLPLVCAVSVLHILCLWWLKLSSQWKSTHWVQGIVTSCFCLVFDSLTVVAEHGSGTESGGVTAT